MRSRNIFHVFRYKDTHQFRGPVQMEVNFTLRFMRRFRSEADSSKMMTINEKLNRIIFIYLQIFYQNNGFRFLKLSDEKLQDK